MISLVFSWMNSLDLQLSFYFCVLKKEFQQFLGVLCGWIFYLPQKF